MISMRQLREVAVISSRPCSGTRRSGRRDIRSTLEPVLFRRNLPPRMLLLLLLLSPYLPGWEPWLRTLHRLSKMLFAAVDSQNLRVGVRRAGPERCLVESEWKVHLRVCVPYRYLAILDVSFARECKSQAHRFLSYGESSIDRSYWRHPLDRGEYCLGQAQAECIRA